MSAVIEVYEWEYCSQSETLYVEAEVEDSILASPQTLQDPEEWVPGRCWATIFWPADDFDAPSQESLESYLMENEPNWTLFEPEEL